MCASEIWGYSSDGCSLVDYLGMAGTAIKRRNSLHHLSVSRGLNKQGIIRCGELCATNVAQLLSLMAILVYDAVWLEVPVPEGAERGPRSEVQLSSVLASIGLTDNSFEKRQEQAAVSRHIAILPKELRLSGRLQMLARERHIQELLLLQRRRNAQQQFRTQREERHGGPDAKCT